MNKQDLNYEQQIAEFYAMKTLQTFYPKDLMWYRNYKLGNKWGKGTIVKQVGPVVYLINNSQNIFQEHNDQLCATYTNIEVHNKRFCHSKSALDSNIQILYKSLDSN